MPSDEMDIFVRTALIRFWRTLSSYSDSFDKRFDHIGAILSYLRQCAATVMHDHNRELRRRSRLRQAFRAPSLSLEPRAFEDSIIEEMELNQYKQRINNWLERHVKDEKELLVFQLSYIAGIKPKRIAEEHGELFETVGEIHQIKERVIRRLKRAMQE